MVAYSKVFFIGRALEHTMSPIDILINTNVDLKIFVIFFQCMLQSWYLSADMQMFLLSPIALIPLAMALKDRQRLKISMAAMFILNILLTVLPIAVKLSNKDYRK